MKQGVFVLPIAALVALLASVATVSAQAAPVSILQHFVDARNEADEAGAVALVTDEVSIVDGSACLVEDQCVGKQALRAHVQLFVADKMQTLLIPPASVSDARITVRAETSSASIRAAGVDRIVSEYTADIHDGRLTSLRVVPDTSDRQTAAFQEFQRAQPQVPHMRSHPRAMIPTTRRRGRTAATQSNDTDTDPATVQSASADVVRAERWMLRSSAGRGPC